jgi:hypothetical protein
MIYYIIRKSNIVVDIFSYLSVKYNGDLSIDIEDILKDIFKTAFYFYNLDKT